MKKKKNINQNYHKSAESQKSSHVRRMDSVSAPLAVIMGDQDWHTSPKAFMSDENTCLTPRMKLDRGLPMQLVH